MESSIKNEKSYIKELNSIVNVYDGKLQDMKGLNESLLKEKNEISKANSE